MNKVIITGARGFIGSHAIPILKKQGYRIHAITSKKEMAVLRGDVNWHVVNLLDREQVKNICQEVQATHLLHLAWYDNLQDRMVSEKNTEWVESTLHLARCFAANGGSRFIMGGSCTEYDWQYGYCSETITPTNPQSLYGECKVAVHKILEKYFAKTGCSYACGRIFFVYGPREAKNRLVAYTIRSLLLKHKADLSHGNQMRDYMHVADVADALVTLLGSNVQGAVNIGSGSAVKLSEIIDIIGEKLNGSDLLAYGSKESPFDFPLVLADVRKLRNELGWGPTYDLANGIDDTINWWKNELKLSAA